MFFLFTPDGNQIVGDSQLVQDARDRGDTTFAVQAHGHDYRIQIHGDGGRLSILAIDGQPVPEDEIGKPIPPEVGGAVEMVSDNISARHVPGGGIIMEQDDDKPLGRNDPCWCGSGVKFKKCHAALSGPGLGRRGSDDAA